MPKPQKSKLEQMAEQATADYLRRSNITFLECAISLMAHSMKPSEVAAILREEARYLEEDLV